MLLKNKGNFESVKGSLAQEVEVLIKLIPYFDVPLNSSGKVMPESKQVRRQLGIAKSEADMLFKRKGINNLFQLISVFFERLNQPGLVESVVKELLPCFFNNP